MYVFIIKVEVDVYHIDKIFGVFDDEKLAQDFLKELEEDFSHRLDIIEAYGEAGSSIRHLVTDLDTEITIKIIKATSNKRYYMGLE